MTGWSYREALDFLFARTTGGIRPGLERTAALLATMGDPHREVPAFHVAGTNGKGSSVVCAGALLRARGFRVGTYTSPHLVDFCERIEIDGTPITEDEVVEFVARRLDAIERLGATFFEATTAMAFEHFARHRVDVSVIETGLGGRLDSTNVLLPVAAGVTSIGIDHVEYLGSTLGEIAIEKAGIFKPGRPAVIGEPDPEIAGRLAATAMQHGATPIRVLRDEVVVEDVAVSATGTSFSLIHAGGRTQVTTPLVGGHQAANTVFAWLMVSAAGASYGLPPSELTSALSGVAIPGRFHRVGRTIFDVAHNPAGARVLAASLRAVRPEPPLVVLFSALGDKDWRGMLSELAPVADRVVATIAPTAPPERRWSLEEVAAWGAAEGLPIAIVPDLDDALEVARAFGGTTLVTGSFHTVGDAMARLQVSPFVR